MCTKFARLAMVIGFTATAALASTPPQASALLSVMVGGAEKEITAEDIGALEQTVIRTENEFTDGMTEFSGPLARDVVAAAGAPLEGVGKFIAANDYAVDIPLEDFVTYDVVFATSMNGVRLSLRDKGPIWIIYPMSDHVELRDPVYNSRLLWQLVRIELP